MTTQEILSRVNEAYGFFDNPITPAAQALKALADDLEAQLRAEIARSKGCGNAVKSLERIMKGVGESRPAIRHPWIDGEGRQCVCDGFVAFRLRNPLPLHDRPKDAGEPIDLDRIFPTDLSKHQALSMPSVTELRQAISVQKAQFTGKAKNFTPRWHFGPEKPVVNAQFLLDAATIFPNAAEIFWISTISPLVIRCAEGDALILPIRIFDDESPKATDQADTPHTAPDHSPEAPAEPPKADEKPAEPQTATEPPKAERPKLVVLRKDEPKPANQPKAEAKAEPERRDTISVAREKYNKAREESHRASMDKALAKGAIKSAKNEAEKVAAQDAYFDACERLGKAMAIGHAARTVLEPDHAICMSDFEVIVRLMHAREFMASNAV